MTSGAPRPSASIDSIRSSPLTLADFGVLFLTAVMVSWLPTQWGGATISTLVDPLVFALLGPCVARVQWRLSDRLTDPDRQAWRLLAMAALARSLSGLVWGQWMTLRPDVPQPWWLLALKWLYLVFTIAALLTFASRRLRSSDRLRFRLDLAMAIVGSAMIAWYFALGPFVSARALSSDFLDDLVHAAGDSLVVALAAALHLRAASPLMSRAALWILAAAVVQVVPDLWFWRADPTASSGPMELVSAAWLAVWLLKWYAAISSATDVLKAIRVNKAVINNTSDTKRAEAVSELMLGAGLSYIALNYDKGYVVDENADPAALTYSNRKQMRDAAVAKLTSAAAIASANTFNTPASWTNGVSYSNTQIAKIANTLAAMTLAYYPRTAAEAGAVNWGQVLTLSQSGMSAGSPVDFVFVGDGCVAFCHEMLVWFDGFDGGRVHTRVANMLDPATQATPYPTGGNGIPNSPDKRLGDGSFGDASIVAGFGTNPKTAKGGTDFVYSRDEIFRPSRGMYHQSNIGYVRYDLSGLQDPSGIYGGYGPAPVVTATQNDLLQAEALIRSGGSLATAATLINKTRVTRGGLPAATAGDGVAGLTTKLGYELEVELLGLGPAPFYWRRRTDGLLAGTPHEMPVPAKELGVKGEALYTWGGTGPAQSTPP